MGNIYQTYGIVEKDAIIPANIIFEVLNFPSLNLKNLSNKNPQNNSLYKNCKN
jgi:hypothetical protein